jgi:hypothetical protein
MKRHEVWDHLPDGQIEGWCWRFCDGCVHEDAEARLPEREHVGGYGCHIPAAVYLSDPYEDIPELTMRGGHVICTRREYPPPPPQDCDGQLTIPGAA